MSTDCIAIVEIDSALGSGRPRDWARVHLTRDGALFDLLGDDPGQAVAPARPILWPGGEVPDPRSGWLRVDELIRVTEAYEELTGREPRELIALIAAMQHLNGSQGDRTRLKVQFY